MLSLRETRRGLGADSEANLESIHMDFIRIYDRFRVRDLTSEIYGRQLLRAVCVLNASHCPKPPADHEDNGRGAQSLEQTDARGIFEGPAARKRYHVPPRFELLMSEVCMYCM